MFFSICLCNRQLWTGYAFATTGAVAVALGLNHLTKVMCTSLILCLLSGKVRVLRSLVTQMLRANSNMKLYENGKTHT